MYRSKLRREADPQYFEKRKQLVEEVPSSAASAESAEKIGVEVVGSLEEEDEDVGDKKPLDPFRSYQPKSRNKIFVK